MKRPALQNKQGEVLRMTFRARKVFGTFEKWSPGLIVAKWCTNFYYLFYLRFIGTESIWTCHLFFTSPLNTLRRRIETYVWRTKRVLNWIWHFNTSRWKARRETLCFSSKCLSLPTRRQSISIRVCRYSLNRTAVASWQPGYQKKEEWLVTLIHALNPRNLGPLFKWRRTSARHGKVKWVPNLNMDIPSENPGRIFKALYESWRNGTHLP